MFTESSLAYFISIIEICEREARETQFALGVVIDGQFVKPSRRRDLDQESGEIVAILTTIAKRAKENQSKGKRRKTLRRSRAL